MGDEIIEEEEELEEEAAEVEEEAEPDESEEESEEGEEDEPETEEEEEEAEEYITKTEHQEIFNKRFGEEKTNEEKLDLLKTKGPEEYFKKYPDEKPKDETPEVDPILTIGETIVQGLGEEYDGLTLDELHFAAPAIGKAYQDRLHAAESEEKNRVTEENKRIREDADRQALEFEQAIGQEKFGKKEDFSPEEDAAIDEVFDKVLAWAKENNKLNYDIMDMLTLMTGDAKVKEKLLAGAVKEFDKTRKPAVPSTGTSKGGGEKAGYDGCLNLSTRELDDHLDGLTEKEYVEFKKNAPASLKKKHGSINWD